MNLESYLKLKYEISQAKKWASLIGQEYSDYGDDGLGYVARPELGKKSISIYYPNGATDYHGVPNQATISALGKAIDWESVIKRSIEAMEERLEALECSAKQEFLELFDEEMK